jgi:hypothetical protein
MWRYIVTVKTSGNARREVAGGPFDSAPEAFEASGKALFVQRVDSNDVTRIVIYRSN